MSFETNEKKPVIEFIADETKRASGLYGPQTILSDLTEIAKMFDPNSVHGDNETKGGIWEENFSEELKNKYTVLLEKMHTHEYDEEPFENSEALVKSGKLFEFFKKYATLKYLEETYYDKNVMEEIFSDYTEQLEKRVTNESLEEKINDLPNKFVTHNSNKNISLEYGKGTTFNIKVDGMYIYPELSENSHKAFCDSQGNTISETYATQKELECYVKKDDYSGVNSLAYFFADNLNNGLFGKIETSGALMCDYIFKNNSMSKIEIDLKNCVSMIGGFLNSTVEKVTFTNGTPRLKKTNNLFRGCTKLMEVKGLDLTNAENLKYMFMNCESLVSLPEIKANGTDFSYAFMNCKSLKSVTLLTPNLQLATGMFTGCDSLNTVTINGNTDYEKLFNALPTVEIGNISIDSDIAEEIKKIATDKGWEFRN